MPVSQNLRFTATVQKHAEFDHPPGAGLMRRLASELAAEGWSTDEMDNWRDCGWSVGCRRGSSEFEIVVSQIRDGQVDIAGHPTPEARDLSAVYSAAGHRRPLLLFTSWRLPFIAGFLHCINLGRPQWRWDGFPDEKHSTSEPRAA